MQNPSTQNWPSIQQALRVAEQVLAQEHPEVTTLPGYEDILIETEANEFVLAYENVCCLVLHLRLPISEALFLAITQAAAEIANNGANFEDYMPALARLRQNGDAKEGTC